MSGWHKRIRVIFPELLSAYHVDPSTALLLLSNSLLSIFCSCNPVTASSSVTAQQRDESTWSSFLTID
eukprot:1556318-Rhodomonas_salina.3